MLSWLWSLRATEVAPPVPEKLTLKVVPLRVSPFPADQGPEDAYIAYGVGVSS